MVSIGGPEALQELGDQMALLRRDPDIQRRLRDQPGDVNPPSDPAAQDAAAVLSAQDDNSGPINPLKKMSKIGRALEGVVSKQHFLQLRRRCLLSDLFREYNATVRSKGNFEQLEAESARKFISGKDIVVKPAKGVSYASHVRKSLIALIWPDDETLKDRRDSEDGSKLYNKRVNQWNAWQREGRVYHLLEQSFGRGVLAFIPSTFRLPE
jgi:hypothetical protein